MVNTRGARIPASTAISLSKLRISRPAPARSTNASATLETTSVACSRCCRAPEVLREPPSRSSSVRSRRSLAATAGAERRAHAHLALARDGTAQDEVRDVRTRDEQHEADRAEQEQQRPLHLAGDLVGERDGGDGERPERIPQHGRVVVDETW